MPAIWQVLSRTLSFCPLNSFPHLPSKMGIITCIFPGQEPKALGVNDSPTAWGLKGGTCPGSTELL